MVEAWSMGAHGMTVELGAAIRRTFAERGAEAGTAHPGWSVVEGALLTTLGRFAELLAGLGYVPRRWRDHG